MNTFACRIDALSASEQTRRAELFGDFHSAITKVTELDDGFEVSLDMGQQNRSDLEDLIGYERRCCAFLQFEVLNHDDRLTVRFTGPDGVKAFLQSEFKLV